MTKTTKERQNTIKPNVGAIFKNCLKNWMMAIFVKNTMNRADANMACITARVETLSPAEAQNLKPIKARTRSRRKKIKPKNL